MYVLVLKKKIRMGVSEEENKLQMLLMSLAEQRLTSAASSISEEG